MCLSLHGVVSRNKVEEPARQEDGGIVNTTGIPTDGLVDLICSEFVRLQASLAPPHWSLSLLQQPFTHQVFCIHYYSYISLLAWALVLRICIELIR